MADVDSALGGAFLEGVVVGVQHAFIQDKDTHVPSYIASSDPGAVGAGIQWIDTNLGTGAWILKTRNSGDTGWETVGGGGGMIRQVARAKVTTQISVSTSQVLVNFNSVTEDPDSTITTGTSDWKWTAPYDCFAVISWNVLRQEKTNWYGYNYVNDVIVSRHFGSLGGGINNYYNTLSFGLCYPFNEGDYWYLKVQGSSGTANLKNYDGYVDIFYVRTFG